jgi:hypothetical protein
MADNTQTVTVQLNLYGETRQIDGTILRSSSKVREITNGKRIMSALSGNVVIEPQGKTAAVVVKVNNEHRQALNAQIVLESPDLPNTFDQCTLLLKGILILSGSNVRRITIVNPIVTGDETYEVSFTVSTIEE